MSSGWVGGLNSIDNPYSIGPDESRDLLNVVSTERGSIKKRNGSTLFSEATNVEFQTIAPVSVAGGQFLVAASSTDLYSVNSSGVVTKIGGSFTNGRWSVIQAPKGTKVEADGPGTCRTGLISPSTGLARKKLLRSLGGPAKREKLGTNTQKKQQKFMSPTANTACSPGTAYGWPA